MSQIISQQWHPGNRHFKIAGAQIEFRSFAPIAVTNPAQLPAAMAQRKIPVAIEDVPDNKILYALLAAYVAVQGIWMVDGLARFAISKGYGVDLSQKWTIEKFKLEFQNRIILTPPK